MDAVSAIYPLLCTDDKSAETWRELVLFRCPGAAELPQLVLTEVSGFAICVGI